MRPLDLLLVAGLVVPACAHPAEPAPPASTYQEALDRWAAVTGHYGVSASVILADGRQWSGTAGKAGAVSLRPEHLLSIASITKTMTGAVILRLAEAGKLSLDDPISRWFQPIANVDPAITVRQLLNHTSGVANYTADPGFSAAIAADPGHRFTREELLQFIGPPAFAPGTRTQYTNTAFILLGMVAERAGGQPIETRYAELWDAIGEHEIWFPGPTAPPGPVATARTNQGEAEPLDRMAFFTGANTAFGMLATARAVAHWGRELFTGTILTAGSQAAMRTLVPAAGNIPGESGAGLGIRSYGYLGRTQFGHSGGSPYGNSLLLFDPATGITVMVVMNQGAGADHFLLAPELLRIAETQ
ncbi:MAG: serine hydrolase domain-containing protein [Gemmatimonadales bacterium]